MMLSARGRSRNHGAHYTGNVVVEVLITGAGPAGAAAAIILAARASASCS